MKNIRSARSERMREKPITYKERSSDHGCLVDRRSAAVVVVYRCRMLDPLPISG